MKYVYLLVERQHKRGETRDLKNVIGCFGTYEEADSALMKMIHRINNGELNGALTYEDADWYLIAKEWGARESRYTERYVNASIYKEGERYGDLYIGIEELEFGKLY